MKIILASQSPRRQELLKEIFPEFKISPADIDESVPDGFSPELVPAYLAEGKAAKVAESHPDSVIIGSDTIVLYGNEIFGKPKDFGGAMNMLRKLSGKTHSVITGVCVYFDGKPHTFSEMSRVTFKNLIDEEIEAYIRKESPYDKAGGYGIQDASSSIIIDRYEGDLNNIIGLPVGRLRKELVSLGII